jgi:hypothetical protein
MEHVAIFIDLALVLAATFGVAAALARLLVAAVLRSLRSSLL